MTQMAGLSAMREGVNLQPQRTTEHIVTAAEVQLLKPSMAICASRAMTAPRSRFPSGTWNRSIPRSCPE